MRRLVVVVVLALLAVGCSSGSESDKPEGSRSSRVKTDACDLLSAAELGDLAGGAVGRASATLVGGLPACRWPVKSGGFVMVGAISASDWAQGLPELLRMMERAGLVKDAEDRRKVQQMRALLQPGQVLTPTEACGAFSSMLELQGQPPGTQVFVNVTPNNDSPLAISGQTCSAGRFTTVTLANEQGLSKPLPGRAVLKALKLAHRRSLSAG